MVRATTRLLSMVHELHKAGYQRIRFSAGMSPSGCYWRCLVTSADNLTPDGLELRGHLDQAKVATYTSGSVDRYFGWSDAPGRSARELAVLFLQRYPLIAQSGEGRDWAYAGWLTEVLGRAERGQPGAFPVFFADYPLDLDPAELPPPCKEEH